MSKVARPVIRNLIPEGATVDLAVAGAIGGATGLVLGKVFHAQPGVAALATIGGTLLGAGIYAASAHRAVRRAVEPEGEAAPMASPQIALDPETAPIAKIVAYLRDHLGPEVTALLSGVDAPDLVGLWASGVAEPEPVPSARLRFGYRTVYQIVNVYDGETARVWLFGTNQWLRDEAPVSVLRRGQDPKDWLPAIGAAEAFVEFVR